MSIQEISLNFKHFLKNSDAAVAGVFIFVALSSFFLGRASVLTENAPVKDSIEAAAVIQTEGEAVLTSPGEKGSLETAAVPPGTSQAVEGGYVASKSGAKYHLPWCSGAQRIKEENKIWFATKEAAEKAGYTPAANCKGI